MKKLTVAALALAAIGFASTAASAATVTAGQNDLVLSFENVQGTGPGQNTNLEVDLGSYANFLSATTTLTLNQLNVADLTAIYGSGWSDSSAGVNWSVSGATPATASFYATSTTPTVDASQSTLSGPAGLIKGVATFLNGQTTTANSSSSASIGTDSTPASGIAGSYAYQNTNNGTTSNYGYNGLSNFEQTGAGTDELYAFTIGSRNGQGNFPNAADLGTFTLSDTGVLTFTPAAAVPEPSAYALGICAMLLFWVLKRRRSVA